MIFSYVGYDKNGKKYQSNVSAKSEDEAKEILAQKGFLIESLKQKKVWFVPKIKGTELSLICRNLSIYLKSSIPLYPKKSNADLFIVTSTFPSVVIEKFEDEFSIAFK